MLLRVVGGFLVVLGAAGAGFIKTRQYHIRLSVLKELERGMELIRCQMNYTLYPIPKLLQIAGAQLKGQAGIYFCRLAKAIEDGVPRNRAYKVALSQMEGELSIPNDGLLALIEWSETLGSFDPEGENSLMSLSIDRLRKARTNFEEDKNAMVKSYTLLGASAGIALLILML